MSSRLMICSTLVVSMVMPHIVLAGPIRVSAERAAKRLVAEQSAQGTRREMNGLYLTVGLITGLVGLGIMAQARGSAEERLGICPHYRPEERHDRGCSLEEQTAEWKEGVVVAGAGGILAVIGLIGRQVPVSPDIHVGVRDRGLHVSKRWTW